MTASESAGSRGDLLDYATAVATAEDTHTVFEELASAADRAFEFTSRVAAAGDHDDSDVLSVRTWTGEPPQTSGISADEGLAGRAFQTGQTIHVENVREDPRIDDVPADAPRSVVTVPIGDAGVFQAFREQPGGFDDAQVAVVEQLAEHASRAIERIRSQQRVAASERRFRSLFEDADDPLVLYSTRNGEPASVEYANEAAEALFDAVEAELRERALDELLEADAEELVPAEEAHSVETSLAAPASMRFLEVTVKPMPDDAGVDAFAELRDVTEQAQRERVLTSLHDATRRMFVSEDRHEIASVMVDAAKGLVNLPYVGVFFASENGEELQPAVNSGLVGGSTPPVLRAGESIAWDVYDSGEPDWVTDVPSHPKTSNPDTAIEEEFLLPLGDHGILLVGATESGVLTREDRDLAGVLATNAEAALDRAERERRLQEQETELRSERNRLAALFENVPSPTASFVVDDGQPIVQSVNSAFESVFGYTETELVGENIDEYIVPPSRTEEADLYNEKLKAGQNINVEVQRLTADGPRDFLLDVVPFRLEEPNVQGYAMYTDITERKERERELERQNDRLEEFASIVSHDLRNPLNVARGYVELAEETKSDEHFERVDDALERMADIVDDVLTLARQGRSLEETVPVSLADAAEDAWRNVTTRDATLETDDPPTLDADPTRLGSLLENLFGNAVEHGGRGVTVTVGELDVEDGTGFYVADDGVGIPAEHRDVVFESGETFSEDGTGFGLSIVEDIAQAHGWRVELAESEAGGARFEFTPDDSPVTAP
ncbi:GAF domain-containing protein [Halobacterium rubrum]|uniref:GAF domain-containing protein n=1 Tax=Halobacterium TaxID=2239 RepID=UPI001F01BBD4|nr:MULTISPECIES: GAF domain-containing protein [Halobacterium]MDH5021110.1 GAF domain-containing protein [Halobacterium rubrum]